MVANPYQYYPARRTNNYDAAGKFAGTIKDDYSCNQVNALFTKKSLEFINIKHLIKNTV
jgi:hypothetical protein